MKVAELLENVQWDNNPISLEYLNKVQKARSFEYCKFFIEINDKYKLGWSLGTSWISNVSLTPSGSVSLASLSSRMISSLSEIEKDKYFKIVNRLVAAKIVYEKAGGKYK